METQHIIHNFEPIYNEHSKILMLGTMPSPKSREVGFYYGHPRNRFWKVVSDVCGEAYPETRADKITFALRNGIAVWDVLAGCDIKGLGFEQVTVVPEQELPDGNFPTVSYPNPEDKKAFALALDLAKKVDADLVLATDPDADRLGVYAKDTKTGEYKVFTGNMSGMLICE